MWRFFVHLLCEYLLAIININASSGDRLTADFLELNRNLLKVR